MNKRLILGALILITAIIPIILGFDFITKKYFYPDEIYYVLGSIAGLAAFVLLFWQYILGIREVSRVFTKDLIDMNKVHKFLGVYGFVLILSHPTLMFIEFLINRSINLLDINISNEYYINISLGKTAFFLVFFTWITSKLLRSKLSFRVWKYLHLLAYIILPLVYLHASAIGRVFNNTLVQYYISALFYIFVIFVIARILSQIGILKRKYTVVSVKKITYDIIEIGMQPLGKAMTPKNGQFTYIQTKILGESHPFTISSYDKSTNIITISVKASGKFSKSIHDLKVGKQVLLDGPYGVFTQNLYEQDIKNVVLIAGGIGVTPFLSFMNTVPEFRNKFEDVVFLYGNKTKDDIAYQEKLTQIAKDNNVTLVNVLSNTTPEEAAKIGGVEVGFISMDLIKKYIKNDHTQYHYFICGPVIMMDKLTEQLTANGVNKDQIHKEEFSL